MGTRTWTIAELAREFGVTARTMRFYEDHGLLEPERRGIAARVPQRGTGSASNWCCAASDWASPSTRSEDRRHVRRRTGETGQLTYLLEQITARRAELEQRRSDIERTLAELDDLERRCRDDLAAARLPRQPTKECGR